MKVSVPRRLSLDEMQGDWEDARETLVSSVGDFQDGTVQLLNGNLSSENTTSTHREVTLKHGVETRIKNPLGVTPVGVYAVKCVGIEIGSDGRPTRKLYSLSTPRIDWRTAGENLMITAQYDLKHTEPYVWRYSSANITIPSGGGSPYTNVTFDTAQVSRGSAAPSYAAGIFTIIEAGTYSIKWNFRFATGIAAGQWELWYRLNGAEQYSDYKVLIQPVGAGEAGQFVAQPKLNAGDTLRFTAYQNSGGPVDIYGLAGNAIRNNVEIARLYNDSTPTGRVTLYFYGG